MFNSVYLIKGLKKSFSFNQASLSFDFVESLHLSLNLPRIIAVTTIMTSTKDTRKIEIPRLPRRLLEPMREDPCFSSGPLLDEGMPNAYEILAPSSKSSMYLPSVTLANSSKIVLVYFG